MVRVQKGLEVELGLLPRTQSPVALAISSPTFLGDRPRGPILGARAEEAPTSPPVALSVLEIEEASALRNSRQYSAAKRSGRTFP